MFVVVATAMLAIASVSVTVLLSDKGQAARLLRRVTSRRRGRCELGWPFVQLDWIQRYVAATGPGPESLGWALASRQTRSERPFTKCVLTSDVRGYLKFLEMLADMLAAHLPLSA